MAFLALTLWCLPASTTVLINEVLASNDTILLDEDGDYSDWIEIFNSGDSAVPLAGWSLSDDPVLPGKWLFPEIAIGPGEYLVVFASGKDRRPAAGELHTNFGLNREGEFLALYENGAAQIESTFDPRYPEQRTDYSYGTRPDSPDFRFFDTPTPGAANTGGNAFPDLPGEISFSREAGVFTGRFQLSISVTGSEMELYYTTDGSLPTVESDRYVGPITIPISTLVRVLPVGPHVVPDTVVSQGYIRLSSSLEDFSSNVPIIIMDSFGYDIDEEDGRQSWPLRPIYAVIINVGENGRAHIMDPPDYVGRAGAKVRGNSSQALPKKQYAVEIWDEFDEDRDVPLLDFPSNSDWVLHAPYGDKSLMRNYLAYNWAREVGIIAMRAQHAEVFFNADDGTVDFDLTEDGDYRGVYAFIEKIKRGDDRVDIADLKPTDDSEPDITGGYILSMDALDDDEEDIAWRTSHGHPPFFGWNGFVTNDPGKDQILPAQSSYIEDYINEFEDVLYDDNFTDPESGYRSLGDVATFIDYHLYTEFLMNADSYYASMFMHKDRLGKLRMGPIWDWNVSLGGTDDWDTDNPTNWLYNRVSASVFWFDRLQDDPEYRLAFADRYYSWRYNSLTNEKLIADVVRTGAHLDEAQQRNFTRWPIFGVWITGASQLNYGDWSNRLAYQDEIDYLINWITTRMDFLDERVATDFAPAAPLFNQQGGAISPGFTLIVTPNGEGIVYYTTDGTDPYQWAAGGMGSLGGGISPTAQRYTSPITINQSTVVQARQLNDGQWSAVNVATFQRQGDVDVDGTVDAVDVQLVINGVLGIIIAPADGDVNGDGAVNAVDVQSVINTALGL
jgi:hypothetical protein